MHASTHRVDVDEESVLVLVGMEPVHKIQQDGIGVEEVRMRNEDGRI